MTISIRLDGPIRPFVSEVPFTTESTELNLLRADETAGTWGSVRCDHETGRWELSDLEERCVLQYFVQLHCADDQRTRTRALIMGLKFCDAQRLLLPHFLAKALISAFDRWFHYDVESLDIAFKLPRLTPKRAALTRRVRLKQEQAWHLVAFRTPGKAVDKELFAEIGKTIGYGATQTEKLYRKSQATALQRYLNGGRRVGRPKNPTNRN